jgi:hypothetical protein
MLLFHVDQEYGPTLHIQSLINDLKKSLILLIAIQIFPTGSHSHGEIITVINKVSFILYINRYDNKAELQEELERLGVTYDIRWRLLKQNASRNKLVCKLTIDSQHLDNTTQTLK